MIPDIELTKGDGDAIAKRDPSAHARTQTEKMTVTEMKLIRTDTGCCEGGLCETLKREFLFPDYDSPLDVDKSETSWTKILTSALQHTAAVVFTITMAPMIVINVPGFQGNSTSGPLTPAEKSFVISQSILFAGFCTIIQSLRIGPVGSNLLSVMGCSYAFLSVSIASGNLATVFGMTMSTAFFESLLIYCLPPRFMKRLFPPWILGITIMLIGFGLCGVGIGNWRGNGSIRDFGIGLWSFCTMVLTYRVPGECIGMWMRNLSVLIAIVSGYIFAACLGAVDTAPISNAEWLTWPHPGKFGFEFDGTLFLPFLIVTLVSTLESIGDISATAALSGKVIEGKCFTRRLRGGLNADSFGSFFSCLCCSFPNTTYSENNGLIALTNVSDYRVGVVFGAYMIILGFLGKFAGLFLSIPAPVLGGVLTILFAMIAVSGFRFVAKDLSDRRVQFILAASLGVGIGISMANNSQNMGHFVNCSYTLGTPNQHPVFDNGQCVGKPIDPTIEGIVGKASRTILDSGLTMGALVAIVLNLLIPRGFLGYEEMSVKSEAKMNEKESRH